jgi:hypothetical protein
MDIKRDYCPGFAKQVCDSTYVSSRTTAEVENMRSRFYANLFQKFFSRGKEIPKLAKKGHDLKMEHRHRSVHEKVPLRIWRSARRQSYGPLLFDNANEISVRQR